MLLACNACHRQYDVGDFPASARVRCACGELMEVPELAPRQIEVLYCANCGGKLARTDEPCAWCRATPDPDDVAGHGACPECYAGLTKGASYCSTCGVAIAPQAVLQALAEVDCPRCSGALARTEGDESAFHQCTACAGIWLSRRDFDRFRERHHKHAPDRISPGEFRSLARDELAREERSPVRCLVCDAVMLPHEYAARSRVVVDACFAHGWWFDAGELDRLAKFVRRGGLNAARHRRDTNARIRSARARRTARERDEWREDPWTSLLVTLLEGLAN